MGFLNINSIIAHTEGFRLFMAKHPSYDIFGITETWLSSVVDDSLIQIRGYTLLRQDCNVNGGGVSLYVCNVFKIKKLVSSKFRRRGKPQIPEYLFCSVQQGDSPPDLVGVIYRPPKIPMQKGSDLYNVLRDLSSEFSHKIIMGDLNADLLSASDDANTIKRLAAELSLQLVHHSLTHHTPTSYTWIDLVSIIDVTMDILSLTFVKVFCKRVFCISWLQECQCDFSGGFAI